jgi:hypothetical protein
VTDRLIRITTALAVVAVAIVAAIISFQSQSGSPGPRVGHRPLGALVSAWGTDTGRLLRTADDAGPHQARRPRG